MGRPAGPARWVRPALLAITVAAAVLYAWNAAGNLEVYYAATARSMSMSWHNFFFASVDPAGTITLDKLPGALWVQAGFVRAFGPHPWALVAPQVVEGTLAVPLMYRIVARVAGPAAGLIAAALMAFSPAVVALNRGNISDTLMILLLLAAVDAITKAVYGGDRRWLAAAGVWVGLAFQAKMIEAWLVAAVFVGLYLLAAEGSTVRRVVGSGVMVTVAGIVSLGWMTVVSLWPASGRPFVDGSSGNSIFSQVFVYNGFGRVDQASPNQLLSQTIGLQLGVSPPAAWNRLLHGPYGLDVAWLFPLGLICFAALAYSRRSAGRRDPVLGSTLMWGGWFAVLFVVFSASSTINPYYLAALAPPVAALAAMASVAAWTRRGEPAVVVSVAVAVLLEVGYAAWLLPGRGEGLPGGMRVIVLMVGAAAALAVVARAPGFLLAALAACVLTPTVASVSVVAKGFGPFDTPFESAAASRSARQLAGIAAQVRPTLPTISAVAGSSALMATQTAAVAAPYIFDTGEEVVPIGGYDGSAPAPTLARIEQMVDAGNFHLVVQGVHPADRRLQWIDQHCRSLRQPRGAPAHIAVYYCI